MKLNSATLFFAVTATGYLLMSLWMLVTHRPVMALLGVFMVVLCVLIIKLASDDDADNR